MLAEIFVYPLVFVVSYTDFIALVPLPTNISGRNERSRIGGVRNYRNSCANQNRVHFVIFPRLYVQRGLEATTVWCETTLAGQEELGCVNLHFFVSLICSSSCTEDSRTGKNHFG